MEALGIIGVILAAWITTIYGIGWITAHVFPRAPRDDFKAWEREMEKSWKSVLSEWA